MERTTAEVPGIRVTFFPQTEPCVRGATTCDMDWGLQGYHVLVSCAGCEDGELECTDARGANTLGALMAASISSAPPATASPHSYSTTPAPASLSPVRPCCVRCALRSPLDVPRKGPTWLTLQAHACQWPHVTRGHDQAGRHHCTRSRKPAGRHHTQITSIARPDLAQTTNNPAHSSPITPHPAACTNPLDAHGRVASPYRLLVCVVPRRQLCRGGGHACGHMERDINVGSAAPSEAGGVACSGVPGPPVVRGGAGRRGLQAC